MEKLLAKEKAVLIHRMLDNHYSFYESLGDFYKNQNIKKTDFYDVDKGRKSANILNFIGFLHKEKIIYSNIIIEEYIGFRKLFVLVIYLKIFTNIKMDLCIHNANSWFVMFFPFSIKKFFAFLFKNFILTKVARVIVVSKIMDSYISQIYPAEKIIVVPFRMVEKKIDLNKNKKITYCIPGNVEEERRNYSLIFNAYQKAKKEGADIQLILLGRLNRSRVSSNLLKEIDFLANSYPLDFKFFESFIPQDDFDQAIRISDYLICNVVQYHHLSGGFEIYGYTKETGVVVLAEAFNKKCLIPSYMQNRGANYIAYESEDDLINQFVSDSGKQKLSAVDK